MSASELLVKIDLISKRLDRIFGVPSCVLGNRCPSAIKGNDRSKTSTRNRPVKDGRKTTVKVEIMRRRTHSAFPLEYREPSCDAVLWGRRLKDEQDAVCGRLRRCNFAGELSGEENEGLDPVRPNNLVTRARKVLQEVGVNDKDGREATEIHALQKFSKPVERSSELDGLLGLRSPSHGGVYGPLVKTSSSLINNLQLESSSEYFVNKPRQCAFNKNQNGVVFTGFSKRKEKELYADVKNLGLNVQGKINERTYCVISANGDRTLNVIRAVILKTPILKAEWIEMCLNQNRFLPFDSFYYDRWQKLIQKRLQHHRVFSGLGKIFICEGCSPPSHDMEWMIKNSGGQISTNPCDCSLIVAPREHSMEIFCLEDMEIYPPVVIEKYILDCITENTVLKFEDYMEHNVVEELY